MNCASRRIVIALPLAALVGLAWLTPNRLHQQTRVHAQGSVNCAQSESSTQDFPPVPNTIDSTCAVIPLDLNGTPTQGNADLYGWLTFVALNWPVNAATCAANPQSSILTTPPAPTWLSYLADDDMFVPSPQKPYNWCFASGNASKAGGKGAYFTAANRALAARRAARIAHLPPKVREFARKHPDVQLFLHHNAKGSAIPADSKKRLTASAGPIPGILEATGDPLTDQNRRFARYTINMNFDEYTYIMTTGSGLWNKAGQQAAGNLTFPWSKEASPTQAGSREAKAAWKVLG